MREPAGFRLFFDPIGPFRVPTLSRFKYALVVLDDFSGLVYLRMMGRLNEWFHHLSQLVKRIEAEKGSERVVAQIGSDSFPAFVGGTQILEFAASRGILLLASPPYWKASPMSPGSWCTSRRSSRRVRWVEGRKRRRDSES